MLINTEVSNKSWSSISTEKAKEYLHYYPKETKQELSDFIHSIGENQTIVDLGCGNGQLYPILKNKNNSIRYIGVDISKNLLDVAKSLISDRDSLVNQDIFEFLNNLNEKYDFLVLSHMIECSESPEMILSLGKEKFKYIAILWFDYPKYDYDIVFVGKNPHSEEEFKPYIRRKIGKEYWKFLIDKNDLHICFKKQYGENNILEIYKQNNG